MNRPDCPLDTDACPDDDALLPLAAGEPAEPRIQKIVDQCKLCRSRVARFAAEKMALKSVFSESTVLNAANNDQRPSPSSSEDLPAVIGRYRIVGKIRVDQGFSQYRTVHPILLNDVNLIVGQYESRTSDTLKHYVISKRHVLANLDVDRILRIYELGLDGALAYLAVEHHPGIKLFEYVQRARLSKRQIIGLITSLANVVVEAHSQGIVHNAIDMECIYVDSSGEASLGGFGLSILRHIIESNWENNAPDLELVDPLNDVRSLALVLCRLLIASRPKATTNEIAAILDTADETRTDSLLRQCGISARLRRTCIRALSKSGSNRYESMQHFATKLKSNQRGFHFR